MSDCDLPDAGCPGNWPRPLRLAHDSIVTVLMNAYMMARSRAAGSPSKIVRVLAERDEALWQLRLTEPEQAWSGTGLSASKIVRARDPQPAVQVSRRTFEDGPHLPVIDIEVEWAEAA